VKVEIQMNRIMFALFAISLLAAVFGFTQLAGNGVHVARMLCYVFTAMLLIDVVLVASKRSHAS
jgi:uncharacterized membrane protein YtjA (UPF0391 family)